MFYSNIQVETEDEAPKIRRFQKEIRRLASTFLTFRTLNTASQLIMWIFNFILIPCLVHATFTKTDQLVLRELFDFFGAPFLNILEEDPNIFRSINDSFPSRFLVLTSVITLEQLLLQLGTKGNVRHGGMPLVALHQESTVWNKFIEKIDEQTLRAAKWVLFSTKQFSTTTFTPLYIPFDCQFIAVNHAHSLPLLTEVYNILKNGSVETTRFGYWSPNDGLSPPKVPFYQRRSNFKNSVFHAVIKHSPPYTYVTRSGLNNYELFEGYFYEVWKELEFRLKFKTKFHIVDRGGEHVIDYLESKEFQFGVVPIAQEPKTATRISLSEPIFEAKVFMFAQRPGSELEWNSYLKPLSTETWLVTLAWMVGSSIALAVLYRIAWHYKASENETDYYVFTFPVALATAFRALCAQGSDVTPRSNACRLLFLSVYVTALVLTSAFSAALFSLLTVPVSKAPFNSFQDILNTKGYRIGIIPSSDIHYGLLDLAERFPNSDQSNLLKILEPAKDFPVDVPSALARVCKDSNYIFIWDLPNVLEGLRKLNRTCAEKVMPGGPMIFKELVGFGFSKGNPHKELIDLHLVQLKNEGIIRRLLLNTWPPRIPNVANTWMKVTLSDISPILYMFSIGVVGGAVILMCERLKVRMAKGWRRSMGQALTRHRLGIQSENTPVAPLPPAVENNWVTRYTDWGDNNNLHRRFKDKYG